MRINKYLSSSGLCSRRKAEEYVLEGRVSVNNKVINDLSTQINDGDVVKLNDQVISIEEQMVYYMLNKPKGYITSMSDDRDRKSISNLTSDLPYRVYPVGRLDYESEGLLFLTNDGDLTYKLTHPKFNVAKKYVVKVEGDLKESELAVLRAGVVIDKVRYAKCKVEKVSFAQNISKVEVTLFEGKNREIRKMFDAIGKNVIFLKRTEMAGIKLGGLKRGEVRPLKDYEVSYLKNLVK